MSAKNSCLVSVIVSTYNSEEFMRECLEDLVRQTIFDRMEVVIVDAASQQNEQAIVKEYQKKYTNIKYIRTEEKVGIYGAWNTAIEASSGKYITTFSTNDHISIDACEVLSEALEHHPEVALVYGDTFLTDTPHESFEKHNRIGKYEWPEYSYIDLLQNCRVGPNPMWRRTVHDDIGHFDENYTALGDYEMWLRMGEKYEFLHIPEVTGLFWMDPDSLSSNRDDSRREISDCREKYQRRFMKRLNGENVQHDDSGRLFEDRIDYIMNTDSADDLLRQYYLGTKNEVYIHKRDLAWFFDINFVDVKWLFTCITDLHDLLRISLAEMELIHDEPLKAVGSFIRAFGRNMKSSPPDLEMKVKRMGTDPSELSVKDILNSQALQVKREYDFRRNFLISEFMKHIEAASKHLCESTQSLTSMQVSFDQIIYRIVAMVAGESLGAYYLYSESLERIAPEMVKVDDLLGRREGVYNN